MREHLHHQYHDVESFSLFFVDYTVVNGTEAQIANINAGGTDVEALSYKDGVTLTNSELAAVCATPGVYATSDLTANAFAVQLKRVLGIASQYLSA